MTNNDILRRMRYTLDQNDAGLARLFALGGQEATLEEIDAWTRREEDAGYEPMTDFALATFLNGLITAKRGVREGKSPPTERELDNNLILRKLRIAFELTTDDFVDLVKRAGKSVSKHEINAFFRRATQRQYRHCNDQYLRWILSGLQARERGESVRTGD